MIDILIFCRAKNHFEDYSETKNDYGIMESIKQNADGMQSMCVPICVMHVDVSGRESVRCKQWLSRRDKIIDNFLLS